MHKKSIILAAMLVFLSATQFSKPAQAVDGPADAAALVTTALLVMTMGYSAWNWYHEGDHTLIVNKIAQALGRDSWPRWYLNNVKPITVVSGILSTLMMKKFCTRIY